MLSQRITAESLHRAALGELHHPQQISFQVRPAQLAPLGWVVVVATVAVADQKAVASKLLQHLGQDRHGHAVGLGDLRAELGDERVAECRAVNEWHDDEVDVASCAHVVHGEDMLVVQCRRRLFEVAEPGAQLAHERDRGTPKADLLTRAQRLPENDGSRLIAVSRIIRSKPTAVPVSPDMTAPRPTPIAAMPQVINRTVTDPSSIISGEVPIWLTKLASACGTPISPSTKFR